MSAVNLEELRMEGGPPVRGPRRPLAPRLAAIGLAALAVGVAATFLVPLLRPARAVATAPVRAASGEGSTARVALAEAAGWVEPDPFPVVVRPLVEGVLSALNVLEGHEVKAGETVVARLESASLLAARDRAAAELARKEAELRRAEVALAVARSLLEQKADLRLQESNARHELAMVGQRLAAARGAHEAALAERDARRAELEGQEKLREAGGTYPVALAKAHAALRAAEAAVLARAEEVRALETELAQDEAALAIAREVLQDPRGLRGAVDAAEAEAGNARAERDAAKVELAIAERELGWAEVRAPIDGVVMRLLAAPGATVGPGEAEGVVALYDPKRLQARVDVPLASVGGVEVGQEVEVRSEVLPGKATKGVVIRVQRESDLLKNTLQVKVRLLDPDPLLRPETLCRARFLAPPSGAGAAKAPALFKVPRAAFRDGAVFVFDPREGGRARRVPVERAGEEEGAVIVRGELSATHRVILDAVRDGERVKETNP